MIGALPGVVVYLLPMNRTIIQRRAHLNVGFAPQPAASPASAEHPVQEIRWFPPAGALDMALLDILGKACKAPIYRVLGGPTRHKVRTYTDSAEAAFGAVGIALPKSASRNQGKAYQNQRQALAKQLPEDRDFVLSAQGSLTPGDAASVAQAIESSHALWFDEPCSVSNLEAVRKVSGETVTPLCFGRGITGAGVFQALLREGLVDVVRPDIGVARTEEAPGGPGAEPALCRRAVVLRTRKERGGGPPPLSRGYDSTICATKRLPRCRRTVHRNPSSRLSRVTCLTAW
jgi:hypothetical protein